MRIKAANKLSNDARTLGLPAGWTLTENDGDVELSGGSTGGYLVLPFSRSGTLTATVGAGVFPVPVNATIVGVRAAVGTAPVGASVICDVNKNGTTIFTTQANRPTIADGQTESANAVPDVTAVAVADLLSVDIDQIGSTTAGANLTVSVLLQVS